MFVEINSFFDVKLLENSLIVIDIDDTILKYEKLNKMWWKNTFDENYKKTKDCVESEKITLNSWKELIKNSDPLHVDKSGIVDLFERSKNKKCKIIFLTARCETLKEITVNHLEQLEIYTNEIYFSPIIEKGIFLKKIKNESYKNFTHVIVIDDLDANLESISENFPEETITLYKMNY